MHEPLYQADLKKLLDETKALIDEAAGEVEKSGSASKLLTLMDLGNILKRFIEQNGLDSIENPLKGWTITAL
jgi:hypothetical protein